jgi:hypothetical protein
MKINPNDLAKAISAGKQINSDDLLPTESLILLYDWDKPYEYALCILPQRPGFPPTTQFTSIRGTGDFFTLDLLNNTTIQTGDSIDSLTRTWSSAELATMLDTQQQRLRAATRNPRLIQIPTSTTQEAKQIANLILSDPIISGTPKKRGLLNFGQAYLDMYLDGITNIVTPYFKDRIHIQLQSTGNTNIKARIQIEDAQGARIGKGLIELKSDGKLTGPALPFLEDFLNTKPLTSDEANMMSPYIQDVRALLTPNVWTSKLALKQADLLVNKLQYRQEWLSMQTERNSPEKPRAFDPFDL